MRENDKKRIKLSVTAKGRDLAMYETNIKIDIELIVCEIVVCIHLARGRIKW